MIWKAWRLHVGTFGDYWTFQGNLRAQETRPWCSDLNFIDLGWISGDRLANCLATKSNMCVCWPCLFPGHFFEDVYVCIWTSGDSKASILYRKCCKNTLFAVWWFEDVLLLCFRSNVDWLVGFWTSVFRSLFSKSKCYSWRRISLLLMPNTWLAHLL